ncbi:hypothetical protein sos41_15820 [Alphaproteobacteria bacterium SO-S41]|nr:hypothetical protein sos41_15820 [Alphaproteobacteria bacterium SO-S41]
MTILEDGPVGLRYGTTPVASSARDQAKIAALLNRIGSADGGQNGAGAPVQPGADRKCPLRLATAIKAFQLRWLAPKGDIRQADGVVDPAGKTLTKLDALAGPGATPIGPGGTDPDMINGMTITQMNRSARGQMRESMSGPALLPVFPKMPLVIFTARTMLFPLLFKIEKDGHIYWVGVAAPPLTTNFTKAQIYFHPNPNQPGGPVAREQDYPTFAGGWQDRLYRYLPSIGLQLAAIRPMLLIVPFMPSPAYHANSAFNVFATRPVETLNAIVTATHREMAKHLPIVPPARPHQIAELGVTSFSSGLGFMKMFTAQLAGTNLIRETLDLDSKWIIPERTKPWFRTTGARARWISQWAPGKDNPPAPAGYTHIAAERLAPIGEPSEKAHAKLGFLTYHWMMLDSVVV